jgi:Uma2 family endonuclease
MTVSQSLPERRYVRKPVRVVFPESAEVPETGVHLELRTGLYLLVRDFVAERGVVGSEQFVYWNPSEPRQCLAPDLIVRMGAPPGPFPTWKTWERGAPHLAVEVVSPSDESEGEWRRQLGRYRRAGISEVVRFAPDEEAGALRIWDRVEGDLVERELIGENALACDTLGVFWCLKRDAVLGRVLRLSRDAAGVDLVLTRAEQQAARVAELEAELARR